MKPLDTSAPSAYNARVLKVPPHGSVQACARPSEQGQIRSDPDLPEWLDGPGLCKWLEDRGYYRSYLNESLARRWREWAHGCSASVWTVDQVMVALGLHLSELPDHLWTAAPDRTPYERRENLEEAT
jgi:hypothetical protein